MDHYLVIVNDPHGGVYADASQDFEVPVQRVLDLSSYDSIQAAWDGRKKTKFCFDCVLPLPPQEAFDYLLQVVSDAHLSLPKDNWLTCSSLLTVHCFTDHQPDIEYGWQEMADILT